MDVSDPEKLAELAEANAELARDEDEIVVEDFSRPGGPINERMVNTRDEKTSKSRVLLMATGLVS